MLSSHTSDRARYRRQSQESSVSTDSPAPAEDSQTSHKPCVELLHETSPARCSRRSPLPGRAPSPLSTLHLPVCVERTCASPSVLLLNQHVHPSPAQWPAPSAASDSSRSPAAFCQRP